MKDLEIKVDLPKTFSLLIGNTDNKLTQQDWSKFVSAISQLVAEKAEQVFFGGFSHAAAPFQNACWVFQCDRIAELVFKVVEVGKQFNQETIALVEGSTVLLSCE